MAASVACIDRVLATTEAILVLLQRRGVEEVPGNGGAASARHPTRKRARRDSVAGATGAAPALEAGAANERRAAAGGRDAAFPRGRPKVSKGRGCSVFAGPDGRRHDKAPSAAVIVSELREHASRIGVPLPADSGPAPASSWLRGDDAVARSMLTAYVETLEAAFGIDIYAAPCSKGRYRESAILLNWLWTVPAVSGPVAAAAAAATSRLAAAARAARDADPDTIAGRLRRCVPDGRLHDTAPSAAIVVSELHEHASRIGVPLPADCGPAPVQGSLSGDDATARSMLTTYVETLEAAFGGDIAAAPLDSAGCYRDSGFLLNWLWSVPVASTSVMAAAAAAATRLAAVAQAARDADADTIIGRLRRCVPTGRLHDSVPSAAVVVSELREHASRIGVPLPADCGPAPVHGTLTGDDAVARSMLTTYAETLEAAFGGEICAAPRKDGGYKDTLHLLNWLWTVPVAAAVAAAAEPACSRGVAAVR